MCVLPFLKRDFIFLRKEMWLLRKAEPSLKKSKANKNQSFIMGAAILTLCLLIVKIIGMLYKVSLSRLYGPVGAALLSNAYELYIPLFTLATAGFPIAVSRMVSESMSKGRYKDVRRIKDVAIPFFIIAGVIAFLLMILFSFFYIRIIHSPDSFVSMIVLAPAIFFGCLVSAYRGYYEGMRNMVPTSVSEVVEAFVKLTVGYSFAYIVMNYGGKLFGISDERTLLKYSVAAAIFGITFGSFCSFLYIYIRYKVNGDAITLEMYAAAPKPKRKNETFRILLKTAIPIGLGALIMSVAGTIDSMLIQRRLITMMDRIPQKLLNQYPQMIPSEQVDNGLVHSYLWGCYSYALTIMNLVVTVTQAFGTTALPNVTEAYTKGNKDNLKRSIETVMRVTFVFTIPAGLGLTMLADPIMHLVYGHTDGVDISVSVLKLMGIAVIVFAAATPMCSMLQAVGRVDMPLKLYAVGMLIKVVSNYIFCGIPEINVQGGSIGTLLCYTFVIIVSIYVLIKETGIVPNFKIAVLRPLLASVICIISASLCYASLKSIAETSTRNLLAVMLVTVIVACVVYFVFLLVLKAITKEDILMLPKGNKMVSILEKYHLIK